MEEHKTIIDKLYFRAFRAIDEPESCLKFIDGHRHVLEIYGITQISSAKVEWMHNPSVWVILVTTEENGKAMGGSRIQQADGKTPLPIEDAVGYMDARIYDMVKERTPAGTGEMCGVWNSWEVAGLGIGSYFLSQVGLAVSSNIGLTSLFGLTAPATYRNAVRGGFRVIREIGIDGKFYYPKEDLTATAVITDELETLPTALDEVRDHVRSFRENPKQSFQIPNKAKDGFIEIFIDITFK